MARDAAIPLLTSSNYGTWTSKARALLRQKKLWVYTQTASRPLKTTPMAATSETESGEQVDGSNVRSTTNEDPENWTEKQEEAADELLLWIDSSVQGSLQ